jgi:hypothetical protein
MITNNVGVEIIGNQAFKLTGSITQNNIPVLEENYVRKMNANNGFSKERLFRKIGSIPITEHLNAIQEGWNMDDPKEVYRYFGRNEDYLSVQKIDTGASGRIIVK